MKDRFFYSLILLTSVLGIVLMTSCGGGNSHGPENNPVMYALVNSTNWRTPDPKAILTDNSIKIYGTSANGQTIILNVKSAEVGEYYLNQTNGNYAEFIPNMSSGAVRYSTLGNENGTGFIRISSINKETKTISGNFYFTAFRSTDNTSRNITDGNFANVPYKYYSVNDTSQFQNTFIFVENNRTWEAKTITGVKNDTAIILFGECDRAEAWQSITLTLPKNISAGVQYITETGPVYGIFQQGFYEYKAINGSITIIENNSNTRTIRGTFFFNYLDNQFQTKSITGGQFEIRYTDNTIP
ncbi:MAG: DUF6252 family protein [Bacteroidales bacterium]|jgi:hypothetical protein|nr:DUF6252 family protein [Bacteroidales bacterium]HOL97055.1 DUF6252 family protein [Bacteroidales bacterium]HOM35964.1 DUF6252 family protein [Bacteroidales bacterium]HPD23422.1 DUF6252 family protein [Bacteroidales bacterium]HRS99410.1 DUF6252 family protein [Bacteroidales bacterium]